MIVGPRQYSVWVKDGIGSGDQACPRILTKGLTRVLNSVWAASVSFNGGKCRTGVRSGHLRLTRHHDILARAE